MAPAKYPFWTFPREYVFVEGDATSSVPFDDRIIPQFPPWYRHVALLYRKPDEFACGRRGIVVQQLDAFTRRFCGE